MADLGKLIVTIGANISGFVKDMEKVNGKVAKFGGDLAKTGQSLTTGLTVPLAALGGGAAKAAIDFESAFAGVRKTVDGTEEEFSALRSGILNLSQEMPAAATEIARVGEAAGQLGIEKENILSFTETMIKLGTATNLSADEAATGLARFANITQLPQEQVANLGSTLVALGNNLATTEAEILEFGLRIAGAGSQVGLSEAQILAFGGALSSVGINAEAGGTAISKVFIEMASSVAEGSDKMMEFGAVAGMTAGEFKQQFEVDAAGAMIKFIEGLGNISEQGGNTFGVLEDLGLSEIRVRDALLRASGAGDLFRESMEIGTKAFEENNALNKEAAQRFETTESQMKMALNQVTALAIEFGTALLPVIIQFLAIAKDLLVPLKEWIAKFQALDAETKENYIKIALMVAAIGPLLMIAGKMITTVTSLIGIFKHVVTVVNALTTVFGLLGKALAFLAANPIGLIIVAVAALVAGIIYLWKTNEDFRDGVIRIWESIKSGVTSVIDGIASSIGWIVDKFNAVKAMVSGSSKIKGEIEVQTNTNSIRSHIPGFATGGMVPGPIGAPMLAMVHGGEEVRTPSQQRQGGGGMTETPIIIQIGNTTVAELVVSGIVNGVRTGRLSSTVLVGG